MGDIDPSGNLNANIVHQFGSRIRAKMATQVQKNKYTAVQMSSDYRADTYTVSLTIGNPDVINSSGIFQFKFI